MESKTVLISGASVAGPALAYWLKRRGFEPTVVEKASGLRAGGQAIDVRGVALEVADRMGILDGIRAAATGIRGMTMVDDAGNELFRTTEETLTGGAVDSEDVEILRDDLCELLYGVTKDDVEYVFNDSIATIRQDAGGVEVAFDRSAPRRFDLVIGADGLHSNTRRLVFGDESPFIRHLGTYIAVFTTPNFLDLDHWQIFQTGTSGTGGGIMSARGNSECRAYIGFESEPFPYDYRDIDAQKQLVTERLGNSEWPVMRKIVDYMADAPDFHFDSVAQIHLPRWSEGRVALVGDAAHCGSLYSGQGTSVAMVEGYALAQELEGGGLGGGGLESALEAYEKRMRPWVEQNQQLAIVNVERRKAEMTGQDPGTIPGPVLDEVKNAFTLD